jgi:hypothetical protein
MKWRRGSLLLLLLLLLLQLMKREVARVLLLQGARTRLAGDEWPLAPQDALHADPAVNLSLRPPHWPIFIPPAPTRARPPETRRSSNACPHTQKKNTHEKHTKKHTEKHTQNNTMAATDGLGWAERTLHVG